MKKVVIELSEETVQFINESLLDILSNLKKINEINRQFFKKWGYPKKLSTPAVVPAQNCN